MNNEQGSLENRFQNHQPQPNPAVWQALEKELKAKRRRRALLWLVAACFLFFTTATVTWFGFLPHQAPRLAHVEPNPSHPQTVGDQPVHTNRLPQHTQADTKPQQSTIAEYPAKTNENRSGMAQPKTIGSSKTSSGYGEGAKDFEKKAMEEEKVRDSEPAGVYSKEIGGTSFATKVHTKKKRRNPLRLLTAHEKDASIQYHDSKTSQAKNGETPTSWLTQKQPTDNGQEKPKHEETSKENGIVQKPHKPTEIAKEDEQTGSSRLQKQENREEDGTLLKSDSLTKKELIVVAVADSTLDTIQPESTKPKGKNKFTLAVCGNVKYAAVRRFQLNEVASENRIAIADHASWDGGRMGYDLGGRAMYQLVPWLGADFSLAVSYLQEKVNVRIKGTEVEGYELTASAQELQVKSRFANHNALVSAKSWATSGALCLRLKPSSFGFTLRTGVGASWLFSTNYTTVSENGEKTDRIESPALRSAPLFYYAGIEKEITTATGTLFIEPNIQYFTKPTFAPTRNLKSTPVYFGLQLGWKW